MIEDEIIVNIRKNNSKDLPDEIIEILLIKFDT